MSLPKSTHLEDGKLLGVIYDFEKAGDVIEEHSHDDVTKHYTIVARGSLLASGPWGEQLLTAGMLMRFKALQLHKFTAMDDNTRIINIRY